MLYYEAFPDLAGVYLEDSWVLELARSDQLLALRLDTVLRPEHPLYEPPKPGGQHSYREAWLGLRAEALEVQLSEDPPAKDASGELDFGHVDVFVFDQSDSRWRLEGDWGQARVASPTVTLRFT